MDLVRTELLPPVLIADMQREARRWALVEQAAPKDWLAPTLAAHLGVLLVRAGCWLETAGRQIAAASLVATPLACGCGE